jgi:hypothetical protein
MWAWRLKQSMTTHRLRYYDDACTASDGWALWCLTIEHRISERMSYGYIDYRTKCYVH